MVEDTLKCGEITPSLYSFTISDGGRYPKMWGNNTKNKK